MTTAADQTERWTLCIDRSMRGPLYVPSVARNCAHRPPPPPIEHVDVVPAAALDAERLRAEKVENDLRTEHERLAKLLHSEQVALLAAREEIERWRKEYVALEEHDYEAVYSTERAEAELAKAREEIASHERAYAELHDLFTKAVEERDKVVEACQIAVGFRAGHPVMCCGQCQDTLANLTERAERAEAELAKAKDREFEAKRMLGLHTELCSDDYCYFGEREDPRCPYKKANP